MEYNIWHTFDVKPTPNVAVLLDVRYRKKQYWALAAREQDGFRLLNSTTGVKDKYIKGWAYASALVASSKALEHAMTRLLEIHDADPKLPAGGVCGSLHAELEQMITGVK